MSSSRSDVSLSLDEFVWGSGRLGVEWFSLRLGISRLVDWASLRLSISRLVDRASLRLGVSRLVGWAGLWTGLWLGVSWLSVNRASLRLGAS
jgi:hypothetical protein